MSRAPGNGGAPARRAVTRWAWRLMRREWRQYVLIVLMLGAAVAAAVGFSSAAYNLAPASGRADFGDANHFFVFEKSQSAEALTAKLDAAKTWFGAIDAIGHRRVPVPGSVEQVDYRAQTPGGPFGAPLLSLRDGRYPAADGEAAVTDWVAKNVGSGIGSTIDLDGVRRTVVGIVENPSKLDDKFVLLPASALAQSDSVTMLVDASNDRVESFRPPGDSGRSVSNRGDVPEDIFGVLITLVVSTLVLFLVALVAAASFTVVAQRRLPQLGMMASIGATEKHVRFSMIVTGALTGVVAGLLGTAVGLAAWVAVAPRMDGVVNFRVDALNVPWWLVIVGVVMAVVTAIGAAWWPGRTMSRIPPVLALTGRPPKPTPIERSILLAAGFIIIGTVCLAIGANTSASVSTVQLVLIVIGTVSLVAGVLLISPLAIRAVARLASPAPVGPRLALRDLGRYQARSGAALAAIAFALGIPVAVVATTAAAENNVGAGNLSSTQLFVHPSQVDGPFIPDATAVADMQTGVDELAGSLDGATALRLDAAADPGAQPVQGLNGTPAVAMVRPVDHGWTALGLVYVATPELLAEYGLRTDDIRPDATVLTNEDSDSQIMRPFAPDGKGRPEAETLSSPQPLARTYTSLPGTLISTAQLVAHGWEAAPSGRWLIETAHPLTSSQLHDARVIAAQHGITIESRDPPKGLARIRLGAVGAGMLLALGILAMTVGLIRSETTGELRTLTATGATSSTRRTIAATTSGALAALGAVLGIAGAYLALAAGHLSNLTPLPLSSLALVAIGTPLVAAAAGWLFSGREPPALARQPLD
jgi:putative ABC transport system permease protein